MKRMTLEKLLSLHCSQPETLQAMAIDQIREMLFIIPGWKLDDHCLVRTFKLFNFQETMSFVNVVAYHAHREDHHPEMHVYFDRVEVRFTTHAVRGLTINDFIMAAKLSQLYE